MACRRMTSRIFWKLFLAILTVQIALLLVARWWTSTDTTVPTYRIANDSQVEGFDDAEIVAILPESTVDGMEPQPVPSGESVRFVRSSSRPWGYLFPILGIVALAASWIIAGWLVSPADQLTQSARGLVQGDYESAVYLGRNDELGELAITMNAVRQTMAAKTAELNRLASVLSVMTDGVITIDANQCVQFANQSAGKLLGFSPIAAQGRPLMESVRSYRLHDLLTRLFASQSYDELEMEWGDTNPKSLYINATYYSEEPSSGVIITISNLSEIRHLQSMRRDFVANVSHELKTPLSSIKAYAETLQNGAMADEKNRGRFVTIIQEQADRLNALISDLLSLARIEQGKTLMEIACVPVHRVVDGCLHEQQHAAEDKQITLQMAPSDPDIVVNADEDGLRQILINLIDNAVKYTPQGGEVTVGWETVEDRVDIFVRDTGLGIPDEMKDRVFERFFRVDKARSRELGGTGLGLAIVKHLAQSFGGSVDVQSELGKGSCFTIRLPVPS